MVFRAGCRDVEESRFFLLFTQLFEIGQSLVARGAKGGVLRPDSHFDALVAPVEEYCVRTVGRRGVQPGENHDGEFETLCGVHGHDAHGVFVGLGDGRLDHARSFRALPLRPSNEGAEGGFSRRCKVTGAIDQEAVVAPSFTRPTLAHGQLHELPTSNELLDEERRRNPCASFMEFLEDAQRIGNDPLRELTL